MTQPAKRLKANKVIEGQQCGWCSRPLQFGEDVCLCTACDTPHHATCWNERQGCSLTTCENAPLRQLGGHPTEPPPPPIPPRRPVQPLGGAQHERLAAQRAQARTRRHMDLRPGMVACPHCGRAIREDAAICRNCKRAPTPDGVYRGPTVNAPGATASLVCGILGITCCFIFGIIAIVKANEAKQAIAEDPRYGGGGMATAGKVLGIISICLFVLGLIIRVLAGSRGAGGF